MKKTICVGLCMWLIGGIALSAGYRVEVKGSYFSSENSDFRDVYGSVPKFGLEGGLDITKNFSIWAGLDLVHKTGKLTLTEEETRVRILPVSAGVRYEIPAGAKFRFHLAVGIQEVFFKEDSILGTTNENALGFIAKGGGVYRVTDAIGVSLFLAWSTCKMTHEGLNFKVGGLDLGAGVEIRF